MPHVHQATTAPVHLAQLPNVDNIHSTFRHRLTTQLWPKTDDLRFRPTKRRTPLYKRINGEKVWSWPVGIGSEDNAHPRSTARRLEIDGTSLAPGAGAHIQRPSHYDDHLSTGVVEFKSPSRSPIEVSVNGGHYNLPLQSDHRVPAGLAQRRRLSDGSNRRNFRNRNDSSVKSIVQLNGNQGDQKLRLQGVLQRLGLRSIASRPEGPDNGLPLQSNHIATMTGDKRFTCLESPPPRYNDAKCPQNATLRQSKLKLIIPASSKDQMKIPLIRHCTQRNPRSQTAENRGGKEAEIAALNLPKFSMLPIYSARERIMAKVLYDFEGQDDEELMIKENEIIQIIRETTNGKIETPTCEGKS